MYILDSILKNVQGNYVSIFESRIAEVFQSSFLNARGDDERKSLMKLVRVWRIFIDQ